jgi:hypothetical protein
MKSLAHHPASTPGSSRFPRRLRSESATNQHRAGSVGRAGPNGNTYEFHFVASGSVIRFMDHKQRVVVNDKHPGPELWRDHAGGRISFPVLLVAILATVCLRRCFSERRKNFSANPANRLRSQPIGERQIKNQ